MADGIDITAGSGTTILTDDTGASGHAQVVKLAYSANASATLITADADGLLVNLGANNDVTVTGTITANLAAGSNNVGDVDVLSVPAPLSTTGNGTAATALRVSLANDSTGIVALTTSSAAIGKLAANSGVDIGDVDVTSITPGTTASSLGKAEDAAHAGADVGVMALAVRKATPANVSDTDGDYEPLQVSAGRLWASATVDNAAGASAVNVQDGGNSITVDNGGTFATQATTATSSGNTTMQNAVSSTGNGTSLTVTGYGTAVVSITGTFTATVTFEGSTDAGSTWVSVSATQMGTSSIATTATAVGQYRLNVAGLDLLRARVTWTSGTSITAIGRANNAVNATKLVSISTTSIAKAEDAASADSDVGVPALAVRKATPANTSGTDGDYEFLQMSAGRLWASTVVTDQVPGTGATNLGKAIDGIAGATDTGVAVLAVRDDALATLTPADGDYAPIRVDSTGGIWIGGTAHDAQDTGNPIKLGARADSTIKANTMVADGDRTDLIADIDGLLLTKLNAPFSDLISEVVTNTNGTSTAFTNFSNVASTRNYVTAIAVYNSSATAGTVDFRDGTGGSVLWTMPIPAGGGSVIATGFPLFRTSAATALAFDVSGALSTVTINVSGFQSKA